MSYNSRRMLTPGTSRKRKEREAFYPSTSPKPLVPSTSVSFAKPNLNPTPTTSFDGADQQPVSSNRLLAGCMAYEFLIKGTLLGQKFDPARAEAVPVNSADVRRNRPEPTSEAEPGGKSNPPSYAEVANVLKSDGVHIPGVVNPTQLARWIKM